MNDFNKCETIFFFKFKSKYNINLRKLWEILEETNENKENNIVVMNHKNTFGEKFKYKKKNF